MYGSYCTGSQTGRDTDIVTYLHDLVKTLVTLEKRHKIGFQGLMTNNSVFVRLYQLINTLLIPGDIGW